MPSLIFLVANDIQADDILFFIIIFQRNKTGISCESSARQMILMKCQALFSLKSRKIDKDKMLSAVVVSSILRVKYI